LYDHVKDCYRWRQLVDQVKEEDKIITKLFQPTIDGKYRNIFTPNDMDRCVENASKLVEEDKVKLLEISRKENLKVYTAEIFGKKERVFKVELKIDLDGKIARSSCNCSFFRLNKLRKGPCEHIMASILMIHNNK